MFYLKFSLVGVSFFVLNDEFRESSNVSNLVFSAIAAALGRIWRD